MKKLSTYEQRLLEGWEDVVKKGQLTFWIMLALKESPKHMAQIKDFLAKHTKDLRTADDKSLYRALRRFYSSELIGFSTKHNPSGPELKVYNLTEVGRNVLAEFIDRNIVGLFFNQQFKELIK